MAVKTNADDSGSCDAPPSPSLSTASSLTSSISWMQKSPNELIPMLKNAYSSIKDKERDLKLAAEIGKSLLENNMALKTNYDHLLSSYAAPYPTPSNSSNSLIKLTEEDPEQDLKYVPSTTREALVEMLEKKNQDLSCQLENVLSKQEELDRSHTRKARQLESQVELLQASLDHATTKIQEMETTKRKTLTKDGITGNQQHDEATNSAILTVNSNTDTAARARSGGCAGNCAQVKLKMDQLKIENDHVNQAKAQLEKNLLDTLHDLHLLKQQCEDLQFTKHDHEQLQMAFDAQHLHIGELKQSLEEHRHVLTRLRERGVYLSAEEDDQGDEQKKTSQGTAMRNNLLTELENAWSKHQAPSSASLYSQEDQDDCSTTSSILLQPFQTIYNQLPNVDTALESILVKAGVVEKDALDDALSLIGRLENEYDHEKFLLEKRHLCYKNDYQCLDSLRDETISGSTSSSGFAYSLPVQVVTMNAKQPLTTGLTGSVQNVIKSMIYMTWKWLRFTLIMTIAIFMSLKEGPSALSL
ncbi:uncharacterized protein ATC70_000653 [Mucor velutinosus]|uniref:Uncharacterized protein n=1 Tax=Mucor velutinosus TaxID=708070 RepID=A0AAN7DID7_9FUNG|nr:hypothetical protein ATC70_000653 [Mucor velutinosus]